MLRLWKQLDYGQRALVLCAFFAAAIWLCPPWMAPYHGFVCFAPGTWGVAAYKARFQYVNPLWSLLSLVTILIGVSVNDHCCYRKHRYLAGPTIALTVIVVTFTLMPLWNSYSSLNHVVFNLPLFFNPDITNLLIGPLYRAGYLIEDGPAPYMHIWVEGTFSEMIIFGTPLLLTVAKRCLIDVPRWNKQRLHCVTCGYNLRGCESGCCPECGKRLEVAQLDELAQASPKGAFQTPNQN